MHNKEMINTIKDKLEISKKLKERAIYEGFTIAGIASIPGSSRLKLRTSVIERCYQITTMLIRDGWKQKEENINTLLKDAKVF